MYTLPHYIYEINLKTHFPYFFLNVVVPDKYLKPLLLLFLLQFCIYFLNSFYFSYTRFACSYVISSDSVLRLEYINQILWYHIEQRDALQPLIYTQCMAQICFLRQCKKPWEKENGFMGIEKSFYSWLSHKFLVGTQKQKLVLQKKVFHLRNWVMEHIFSDEFVLCFAQYKTSEDVYLNNTVYFTGAQRTEFKLSQYPS